MRPLDARCRHQAPARLAVGAAVAVLVAGVLATVVLTGRDAGSGSAAGPGGAGARARSPAAGAPPAGAGAAAEASAPAGDGGRADTVSCRTVRYTPPDGDDLSGDLCGPPRPRAGVAILVIHGGGGYQGDRESSAGWVRRFGEAGYLTLATDYRLFAPGSTGPFYPRAESDLKVAVQWLRRNAAVLHVDPDRIVAQGISAGAQLGGALLVTPDDPAFDAQARWAGISDRIAGFIGLYGYYDGYQLDPVAVYGGPAGSPDPAVADRWRRSDSTARAAGASGPALLFATDDDWVIPADQTRRFAAALHGAGKDVESTILPAGGHGFDRPAGPTLSEQGEEVARVALTWLDRHFPQ